MKSERAYATHEPSHLKGAGMLTLIGHQAVVDDGQIAEELIGRLVLSLPPIVGCAQSLHDLPEKDPVRHAIVARR